MLPLSHTFVATEVTGRKNKLLIFGSVLPDIATTSGGEIGRDKIHYSPRKFYDFVEKNYPDLIELAAGVRLHSNIDKGADYYSDDNNVGFAKIQGKKLSAKVAKMLGIEEEESSLVLAHNFIEAGVDLNLLSARPDILDTYAKSIEGLDLQRIAICLADYLDMEVGVIIDELKNFTDFLSPKHLENTENVAKEVVVPLIDLRFGKRVNANETEDILKEAILITKHDYMRYLETAIKEMRKDFSDLINT